MTDRRVFFATVVFLGIGLLTCIAGIIGLAATGRGIPGVLETVAAGLVTGLIGLLVRGPTDQPQQVVVANPPAAPVPVEEQP